MASQRKTQHAKRTVEQHAKRTVEGMSETHDDTKNPLFS